MLLHRLGHPGRHLVAERLLTLDHLFDRARPFAQKRHKLGAGAAEERHGDRVGLGAVGMLVEGIREPHQHGNVIVRVLAQEILADAGGLKRLRRLRGRRVSAAWMLRPRRTRPVSSESAETPIWSAA